LNRRALSGGAGAQDDEIVAFHGGCGAEPGKLPRKYTTGNFVVSGSLFFGGPPAIIHSAERR
jgi:hypothetical protein